MASENYQAPRSPSSPSSSQRFHVNTPPRTDIKEEDDVQSEKPTSNARTVFSDEPKAARRKSFHECFGDPLDGMIAHIRTDSVPPVHLSSSAANIVEVTEQMKTVEGICLEGRAVKSALKEDMKRPVIPNYETAAFSVMKSVEKKQYEAWKSGFKVGEIEWEVMTEKSVHEYFGRSEDLRADLEVLNRMYDRNDLTVHNMCAWNRKHLNNPLFNILEEVRNARRFPETCALKSMTQEEQCQFSTWRGGADMKAMNWSKLRVEIPPGELSRLGWIKRATDLNTMYRRKDITPAHAYAWYTRCPAYRPLLRAIRKVRKAKTDYEQTIIKTLSENHQKLYKGWQCGLKYGDVDWQTVSTPVPKGESMSRWQKVALDLKTIYKQEDISVHEASAWFKRYPAFQPLLAAVAKVREAKQVAENYQREIPSEEIEEAECCRILLQKFGSMKKEVEEQVKTLDEQYEAVQSALQTRLKSLKRGRSDDLEELVRKRIRVDINDTI